MEILVDLIDHEDLSTIDAEELTRIKADITLSGLLHPIAVSSKGIRYSLITGRVRLRAFKELGIASIPAKVFDGSLTSDQCKDIALSENLRRHNLPWYDQVELEKELHELRVRQHGQVPVGRRKSPKEGWSQQDTADELSISAPALSNDLFIANALRSNPNLKKVKDKKTALRLIRGVISRQEAEDEALMEPDFEMDQVFLGDSLDILKNIPPGSFDACITDPPWSEYKDDKLIMDESTVAVFKEVYKVLKPDAFLYLITSTTDIPVYQKRLVEFGYKVQKYPIIWAKTGTITHGKRAWEYARNYEPILIAVKGSPVLTSGDELSAILTFPSLNHTKMIHPHEKPIELLKKILDDCTFQGAKILDPFAGSGVTLQAAKEMSRRYIGIERDSKFYTNIEKRLKK